MRTESPTDYGMLLLASGIYLVFITVLWAAGGIAFWERIDLLPTAGAVPAMLLIFAGGLRGFRRWGWYAGVAGTGILLVLFPLGTVMGLYGLLVLFRRQIRESTDAISAYLTARIPASLRELLRTLGIFTLVWLGLLLCVGMIGNAGLTARGFTIVGPLWAILYLCLLLLPWIRHNRTATLVLALAGSYLMTFVSAYIGDYYSPYDIAHAVPQQKIAELRGALYRYRQDAADHRYPATLTQLECDTAAGWTGPYYDFARYDPWGYQYQYVSDGSSYTLQTEGRAGSRWWRIFTYSHESIVRTVPVDR